MQLKNTREQFGLVSKALHWFIALLIIALLGLGWWMVDLSYYDPSYHNALSWHKSLGICAGLLAFSKLGWKFISPNPQAQSSLTPFEDRTSRSVHLMLLVAMLLIPTSGYLISSSEGAPIEVFNWFTLPAMLDVSDDARDIAIETHFYVAYSALGFIVLHAAAALKHQLIDGKHTIKRML